MFARSDAAWTTQGELLGTSAEVGAGRFGASVAVSSGGFLALVGAPMSDGGTGQAFTFWADYATHQWSYHQRMDLAGVSADAHFGTSVAVDGNGSVALVGAPRALAGAGAVYPYTYYGLDSPLWQDQPVIQSPATGASFGASVAISSTGGEAIIGAPLAGNGGAAYEYLRAGMQEAVFTDPTASPNGQFGSSVSLAGQTTNEVLVGAPGDNSGAGAAYEFDTANGTRWLQDPISVAPSTSPASGDAYGTAVALSADGSDALVGAPGAGAGTGTATSFVSSATTTPDPPENVQAVAGAERAIVSWATPYATGGAPITGYTVTSSPGGLTCTTSTSLTCTVSGLTDGQPYRFTVTATNQAGTSAASSPSTAATPTADPNGRGGGTSSSGGSSGGASSRGASSGGASSGGASSNGASSGGASSGGASSSGASSNGASSSDASSGSDTGGRGHSGATGTTGHGNGAGGGSGITRKPGAGKKPSASAGRRDSTPPSMPSGALRVTNRTRTSLTCSWGRSTDGGTGVGGYRIYDYLGGRWILAGTTAASRRWFVRAGLRQRTRHRFAVRAYDAAGNVSAPLIGTWTTTA